MKNETKAALATRRLVHTVGQVVVQPLLQVLIRGRRVV